LRHAVEIDYPLERMEANRRRMEERGEFRVADRAPVAFCVVPRYFAPLFGLRYRDFFSDPETQFHWQLQFAKRRMETIREDVWCSPVVTVYPYFDNVINPSACGAEVQWQNDETPRAAPTVRTPDDAARYEPPAPDAGLWGTLAEWHAAMRELARDTRVTFAGEEGRVEVAPLTIGGEGPHMVAVDLVGPDFYWWMIEYPNVCHHLLTAITQGMIAAETRFREIDPRPRGGYGLAEDSAQIMSVELFRAFCVPYVNRLYDRLGAGYRDGRGMHMCGDSTHLLASLRDDARISSFNLFGYRVACADVARELGGRVLLWGNLDPMRLRDSTPAEARAMAREVLEALAPCGGLLLGDGANVCPGTPVENLNALTEAAEEYGAPSVVRR